MFGLNHKFAVNAPQCDIKNPVPSDLFPIPEPRPKGSNQRTESYVTVPEPFELMTEKRAEKNQERLRHNFEGMKLNENSLTQGDANSQ